MSAGKTPLWICAQCGGLHFPIVIEALGKCPSCGNPTGEVQQLTEAERNK